MSGSGLGPWIDSHDVVIRMWDSGWQKPSHYGRKYDVGFYEIHPAMMEKFHQHLPRQQPTIGWIASVLGDPERSRFIPGTELIDQWDWCQTGMSLGGVGATGRLQYTRGTLAALWALSVSAPGDTVTLLGFDNIARGAALALRDAFPDEYFGNPGTFSFRGYGSAGSTKEGNHDFAIERPVLEHYAREFGATLKFRSGS